MLSKVQQSFMFLAGLVLFTYCNTPNQQVETLKIATSANMQFVMRDLIHSFEQESGIASEIIVGSSGKLSAQIINGAPYDVFVSADMIYPQALKKENMNASDVILYSVGKLVVWSKERRFQFEEIDDKLITKIAIANPKTAPYGKAALEAIQHSFNDSLQNKLVFGESISQVNQFILADQVDLGFSSIFIVNAPSNKNLGYWSEVPEHLYEPIAQGMISIKGKHEKEAQQLLDFIMSNKGQAILKSYH
ncbi:molybdate ABC transporter substrate-binding protein [Flammeovirga sp. EKP202]|uniref:molybdate ABC transporter substrate-binding protein n=1 Tax=Flammeovirga sp. EKP202 TaxID=2770592 RepID=UPI00165ED466|nr:molybdate ABC transporter substrate-binding protein [Flammeovirga sp. EKP202]MBD0402896.1 molybdate ABC transporter substrate-binding protein [Flammeovirga sp. EKP202]